jgi:hypothetical protein
MLKNEPKGSKRITVGEDKAYDASDHVAALRRRANLRAQPLNVIKHDLVSVLMCPRKRHGPWARISPIRPTKEHQRGFNAQ